MLRFGSGLVAAIVWLGLGASNLQAAAPKPAQHYGAGVHDFYQGRYFEAIRHFDLAIGFGGRDPRVYFFRGLANRRLGRSAEARGDFMLGSQLEVALKRRDVGMALQRIQGPDRLMIEQYRREARQLPEQVVRKLIPPPVSPLVRRRAAPRRPQATKAEYVLTDLPADNSDPFREEAPGLLGRGELQTAVEQPAGLADGQADEAGDAGAFGDDFGAEPFGSGVVAEAESDDATADPFAMGDDSPDRTNTGSAPQGPMGAALRAFGRALAPAGSIAEQGQKLLDNARGGGAPAGMEDDTDPFAVPADGFETTQDDGDPFDTPADTTEDAGDPLGAPADTAEDAGDPFADDTDDPFAF